MAQAIAGENYEFQAQPQVVKPNKAKYRPQPIEEARRSGSNLPTNIMFDKRVMRGNTYANSQTQGDKKLVTLKQFKKPTPKTVVQPTTQYNHASTPRPLPNRHNLEVQTDDYIETLTDKPPEQEMDAQTDFYIDKPPDRLFKPKKNGIDRETQIWEGDLFDFDQEVEPILQVLMNKIFEQSRMEVLEEEELRIMKEQQKEHEKSKNSVLSEMQRLEQVQIRLDQEESRRRLQYETMMKQKQLSHQKIVSRQLAKQLIWPLKKSTFQKLEDLGYFRDPLESALMSDFLPWVFENVLDELVTEKVVDEDFEQLTKTIELDCQQKHRQALIDRQNMIDEHYAQIQRVKEEKLERLRQMEEERLRLIELERLRLEEEERLKQQGDQQDDAGQQQS